MPCVVLYYDDARAIYGPLGYRIDGTFYFFSIFNQATPASSFSSNYKKKKIITYVKFHKN